MKTRLKLFFKWGIQFEDAYSIEEKSERKVQYANSREVENEIVKAYAPKPVPIEFADDNISDTIIFSNKKCLLRTEKK